jgi:hypothetical protein
MTGDLARYRFRWCREDNELLRAMHIAPVEVSRVAVLRHPNGTESWQCCCDEVDAVRWLQKNVSRGDDIMIVSELRRASAGS